MKKDVLQHYKIKSDSIELDIEIDNTRLLVIYGRHINGYFIALPGLSLSCEALSPEEIKKNTIYLTQTGIRSDYATAICESICEYWNKLEIE